jgi:hypothetical protein
MALGRKTGGRKKGTPNKMTAELKSLVFGALNEVGGQAWLVKQAKENPTAFMTMLGKFVPLIGPGEEGEHSMVVTWASEKS